MLFLPIVERELRVGARNWRTYYSRVLIGGVALAAFLYLIWALQGTFGRANTGMRILAGTSLALFVICFFGGIARLADCISQEKREDTLGFLFLTHLKGYDVVLGKLVAQSLTTFFLVLSVLPVMAIPILMGGVSGTQLFRVAISLLNAIFFSGAVALLVSTFVRVQRVAHGWVTAILVLHGILLPVGALFAQRYSQIGWLPLALNLPSPSYALAMAFDSALGLSTNFFWGAIGLQVTLSVIALALASALVPRLWQTRTSPRQKWAEALTLATYGNPEVRKARRERLLERNPIHWLTSRERFGPAASALFALITFSVAAWIVYRWFDTGIAAIIIILAAAANDFSLRIRVGTIASSRLGQDRQSGALEMILSTPLPVSEILRGVWMSIRGKLLWTYVPLLIVCGLGGIIAAKAMDGEPSVVLLFVAISISDFVVMGYAGMWEGMRVRNVKQAAGAALFKVVLRPWGAFLLVMPLLYHPAVLRDLMQENEPYSVAATGIAIWILNTIVTLRSAKRNLALHFREAATDRYNFEQRTSLLVRVCRWFPRRPQFAPSPARSCATLAATNGER